MGFQFNLIDDMGAQGLEAYHQELIDKDVQGHFRYEAEMSLAFLAWRKGDGEVMRHHFSNAATEVVAQLSAFTRFGTDRVITQFETALLIVNVFGCQQEKIGLSRIHRDAWYFPATPEFLPLAELLAMINRICIGDSIQLEAIEKIEQENEKKTSSEFYYPWIVAVCGALRAIHKKNAGELEITIHRILVLHEKETDEGYLRKRVEAMVSLWSCVVYKIATNNSLKLDIESPYIPKKFI